MRKLKFKPTYTFGIAIIHQVYLKTQFKYKIGNGKYANYFIKDVVFVLSFGNCRYIFMINGDRLPYTKEMTELCLWFPENYFDSFYSGIFINKSMILSHTGKSPDKIIIYLPLGMITSVAKDQQSRFLNVVDAAIAIRILDEDSKISMSIWFKSGQKKWIEDYGCE